MALTQLSDVVVPEIVMPEIALQITLKSAFVGTDAVLVDPKMAEFCSGNFGKLVDTPKYNAVSTSESNVGSDDPSETANTEKMTQASIWAIKHIRNNGWQYADLVYALSQPDPAMVISEQLGAYWARQIDAVAINSLVGVLADNVATNSGDMVYDITGGNTGTPTDAEIVSGEALVRAMATLGDNMENISAIVMHSAVYANLQVRNLITTIPDSNGVVAFPTFMGKRVTVSDALPAVTNGTRIEYTTILLGQNALRFGAGAPKTPLEIFRDPSLGNGEGVETLWSRNHFVMTPTNYSFDTTATIAGTSPTWAELANADTWTRTVERKSVAVAFLKTNG